jgi:hypothetical protein
MMLQEFVPRSTTVTSITIHGSNLRTREERSEISVGCVSTASLGVQVFVMTGMRVHKESSRCRKEQIYQHFPYLGCF